MTRYEYKREFRGKVAGCQPYSSPDVEYLNEQGKQGWMLCALYESEPGWEAYVFKRELLPMLKLSGQVVTPKELEEAYESYAAQLETLAGTGLPGSGSREMEPACANQARPIRFHRPTGDQGAGNSGSSIDQPGQCLSQGQEDHRS